jgi:hypothetical protein
MWRQNLIGLECIQLNGYRQGKCCRALVVFLDSGLFGTGLS